MQRRELFGVLAAAPWCLSARRTLRVAAFRADATPPLGEPLIWITPATEVLDPLWAKGVILDDGERRVVLCAVDWCGIGGSVHTMFRKRIAEAAGTRVEFVSVHSVHQHTAPYVEGDGAALLEQFPDPPLRLSSGALTQITGRIASAVSDAIKRLAVFDNVGLGRAAVERVASARRIVADDGTLVTRFSTGGRDPKLASLPEGAIDTMLRTVTFARGEKPLVRLHYYATHPQTFCCDGRVTADFVGAAREEFERDDNVPQIYFTGCAGDVTVGKYNDTSRETYEGLRQRMVQGFRGSADATRFSAVENFGWSTAPLMLPPKKPAEELSSRKGRPGADRYRVAITTAFARRTQPIPVHALSLGGVRILHLPGEPMLAFQRYAEEAGDGRTVIVAGYGDISPGYLCTDEALRQGGYEPSASNAAPGSEARLKDVIRRLLRG